MVILAQEKLDYMKATISGTHLGTFATQLQAALAYDAAAFDALGANAKLNFPERFKKVG